MTAPEPLPLAARACQHAAWHCSEHAVRHIVEVEQ